VYVSGYMCPEVVGLVGICSWVCYYCARVYSYTDPLYMFVFGDVDWLGSS
jgi:hypothetical protein